jgi:hypothetical protein
VKETKLTVGQYRIKEKSWHSDTMNLMNCLIVLNEAHSGGLLITDIQKMDDDEKFTITLSAAYNMSIQQMNILGEIEVLHVGNYHKVLLDAFLNFYESVEKK